MHSGHQSLTLDEPGNALTVFTDTHAHTRSMTVSGSLRLFVLVGNGAVNNLSWYVSVLGLSPEAVPLPRACQFLVRSTALEEAEARELHRHARYDRILQACRDRRFGRRLLISRSRQYETVLLVMTCLSLTFPSADEMRACCLAQCAAVPAS